MPARNRTPAQEAAEVAEASRLHALGMTTTDIAKRMTRDGRQENPGYTISQATVWRRIQAGVALYSVPATKDALKAELSRLDAYLEALSPKLDNGDVAAIKAAVSIGERRAKLLGLDKPTETKPEASPTVGLLERLKAAQDLKALNAPTPPVDAVVVDDTDEVANG